MELTVARSYAEHIVVTDLAIARIERRSDEERRQVSTIVFVIGGLVGPLLAAMAEWIGLPGGPTRLYLRPKATPALEAMGEVLTCWASEVPPELSSHPRWPKVEGFRPVTFYPRATIESVGFTRWGALRLLLRREASREVLLPLPWWGRRVVRQHLLRAGYALAPFRPARPDRAA